MVFTNPPYNHTYIGNHSISLSLIILLLLHINNAHILTLVELGSRRQTGRRCVNFTNSISAINLHINTLHCFFPYYLYQKTCFIYFCRFTYRFYIHITIYIYCTLYRILILVSSVQVQACKKVVFFGWRKTLSYTTLRLMHSYSLGTARTFYH